MQQPALRPSVTSALEGPGQNIAITFAMEQELISRLDSRTLPLKPRHRCARSVPSTCLRNDVLANRLQAAC